MTLVVPCFNEAARLDRSEFIRMCRARAELSLLFVDDGSKDDTATVLDALSHELPGQAEVLRLPHNLGKAEAVRQGLQRALSSGTGWVGFADADLSTPADQLLRMISIAEAEPIDVLLGARVRLLGAAIDRHPMRHYLGRMFATVASLALGLPIYDTQCGAKFFRRNELLEGALAKPFESRWIFDVELLARLTRHRRDGNTALKLRELPLEAWREVAGSKLKARAMLRGGLELLWLLVRLRMKAPGSTAFPE